MEITTRRWGDPERTAYMVDGYAPGGRRIRRQFKTKRAAQNFRLQFLAARNEGSADSYGSTVTVADIVSQWADQAEIRSKAGEIERSTARGYQQHADIIWKCPAAHIRAGEARATDFETLADALHGDGTIATWRARFLCVRMAMGWAVRRGLVPVNHAQKVRIRSARSDREHRQRIPDRPGLTRLVRACLPGDLKTPTLGEAFLTAALFTGCRVSELMALTRDDVRLESPATVTISKRLDRFGQVGAPKSRSAYREIPLAPTAVRILRLWMIAAPATRPDVIAAAGAPLLFPTNAGGYVNPANIRHRAFVPALRRAKLVDPTGRPLYRLHDIRHAAASILIDAGCSAKSVQEQMGHSSITVTLDIYGHLFHDDASRSRIADAFESGLMSTG